MTKDKSNMPMNIWACEWDGNSYGDIADIPTQTSEQYTNTPAML